MSTICRLVQGSAEWHEHRRKYRNASETPVVLGVSPWQTPYQLWQHKLGLVAAGRQPRHAARPGARAGGARGVRGAYRARHAAAGGAGRRVLGEPGRHHARRRARGGDQVPVQGPGLRAVAGGRSWRAAGALPLAGAAPADGDQRRRWPTCSCSTARPAFSSRCTPDPASWPRIRQRVGCVRGVREQARTRRR